MNPNDYVFKEGDRSDEPFAEPFFGTDRAKSNIEDVRKNLSDDFAERAERWPNGMSGFEFLVRQVEERLKAGKNYVRCYVTPSLFFELCCWIGNRNAVPHKTSVEGVTELTVGIGPIPTVVYVRMLEQGEIQWES